MVCEEEPYFLALVRYLHLNPLRAGVVPDFAALDDYPYSGHTAVLGKQSYPWQETAAVLERFSPRVGHARRQYRQFVAEGVAQGQRAEFQGGGLVRSLGGWEVVKELRQGREQYRGDERVLGSSAFVEQICKEAEMREVSPREGRLSLEAVVARVCQATGVEARELRGGSRRAPVSRARAGVAYLWIEWLGHSGPVAARHLGIRPQTIYQVAKRGQDEAERWQRVLMGHPKP